MTDKIDFGGKPWQAIPRATLRDPRLTHRAKGGLVILLSHEEGWVRSCIAILQREGKGGRKQAQAIMAELRDLGYAELVHSREGNLLKSHYVVRAESATFQPRLEHAPDLPGTDPARFGSTGNGAAVVEALDVEALDVDIDAESNTPPASTDNNPFQPTDRQMYFGERLDVSVPSIVKLNKAHGRAAVLAAMEQLHGFPPADPVENVYGWLDTVASFKAVAV